MDHKLIRILTIAGSLASSLLTNQVNAGCGQQTPTITNLPSQWVFQVNALGAGGDLTGYFYSDTQSPHVYRYRAGEVTDLGAFSGDLSEGFAINTHSEIAGDAMLSDGAFHGLRSEGTNIVDLGTLGGSYSSASRINDAGQIAGESFLAGDTTLDAFLYDHGIMMDLGNLGGGYSSPTAMNANGAVVGLSSLTNNDQHGFLYSAGTLTDLGTLGGNYSSAFAVNDNGLVAGESSTTNGETHGFVFSAGVMTDMGTLGGTYSTVYGINKSGNVIGVANSAGDATSHGFIYSNGVMTDLGTLGGAYSFASAINNAGQVVGSAGTGSGATHAFLWENGAMVDLNSVIPGSGWELTDAQFINDAGRIIGSGVYNGTFQTFILDLSAPDHAPVALAGSDVQAECGSQVSLDGSQSSDPDNDALSYQWIFGGFTIGTNAVLSTMFPLGTNVVTLVVTDPCGSSAQTNVTVTVVDTIAPTIVGTPVLAPISANGNCEAVVPDVTSLVIATDGCSSINALTVSQSPTAGTAVGLGAHTIKITAQDAAGNSSFKMVTLAVVDTTAPVIVSAATPRTVSVGADCQGTVPDVLSSISAFDTCTPANELVLSQSPAAGTVLPKGSYVITVTVTDAAGNQASQAIPLTLADTTAPVIQTISVDPSVLSTPNHKLTPVTVSATATDNCDSAPSLQIVSITANETVSAGDIQITGSLTASLAASRDAAGSGRIYTITVRATDASGNSSTGTVTVTVPQGNGKK
jgi:probable HAF family extracellular repeat protein